MIGQDLWFTEDSWAALPEFIPKWKGLLICFGEKDDQYFSGGKRGTGFWEKKKTKRQKKGRKKKIQFILFFNIHIWFD